MRSRRHARPPPRGERAIGLGPFASPRSGSRCVVRVRFARCVRAVSRAARRSGPPQPSASSSARALQCADSWGQSTRRKCPRRRTSASSARRCSVPVRSEPPRGLRTSAPSSRPGAHVVAARRRRDRPRDEIVAPARIAGMLLATPACLFVLYALRRYHVRLFELNDRSVGSDTGELRDDTRGPLALLLCFTLVNLLNLAYASGASPRARATRTSSLLPRWRG